MHSDTPTVESNPEGKHLIWSTDTILPDGDRRTGDKIWTKAAGFLCVPPLSPSPSTKRWEIDVQMGGIAMVMRVEVKGSECYFGELGETCSCGINQKWDLQTRTNPGLTEQEWLNVVVIHAH